jgi:RNA polymerase sigma-70 factor, ECF subfamily
LGGVGVSKSQMATDRELLSELYTKYGSRVYARCAYLLRDKEEARDAMHDVFIKVQHNLASFRGDASPITWMTRIATNHCLNIIRAKRAAWHDKYKREVESAPFSKESADASMSLKDDQRLLRLALANVDPELAEIGIYYFVDEMTQHEICALVGLSAPTLRKRLRELIAVAREEIKKVMPDAEFMEAPV